MSLSDSVDSIVSDSKLTTYYTSATYVVLTLRGSFF